MDSVRGRGSPSLVDDESDGGSSRADIDVERDDAVTSRQGIMELLYSRRLDDSCFALLSAIRELAGASLPTVPQLQNLLRDVSNLARSTGISNEDWRRALSLFALDALRSLTRMVIHTNLSFLSELLEHTQYWERQRGHTTSLLFQNGWAHSLEGLRAIMDKGFQKESFNQEFEVEQKLEILHVLKDDVLVKLGQLHTMAALLDSLDSLESDIAPFERHARELYVYIAFPKEAPKRIAGPVKLVRLLEDIVVSLADHEKTHRAARAPSEKPSHLQRYWLGYTCAGLGVLGISALIMARKGLSQQRDEAVNWTTDTVDSAREFARVRIEEPILNMVQYVFQTFRGGESRQSVGNTENQLRESRKSLALMIEHFGKDEASDLASMEGISKEAFLEQLPQRAQQHDMAIVMQKYVKQVEHPLLYAASGELPRCMLIQVQKLKLDIENLTQDVKRTMDANEINFVMTASIPSFLLLGGSFYMMRWLLFGRRRNHALVEIRAHVKEIENILVRSAGFEMSDREMGRLMHFCFLLQRLAETLPADIADSFKSDLKLLVTAPLNSQQRILVVQRMYRSYNFLCARVEEEEE